MEDLDDVPIQKYDYYSNKQAQHTLQWVHKYK